MRHFDISEEEKKRILDIHNIPKTNIAEQKLMWDKGNEKALMSLMNMGKPKRRYKIEVEEPFSYETTDEDEFYKLKHILIKTHTKFNDSEEKIEY